LPWKNSTDVSDREKIYYWTAVLTLDKLRGVDSTNQLLTPLDPQAWGKLNGTSPSGASLHTMACRAKLG
jgi:hypothetical protein